MKHRKLSQILAAAVIGGTALCAQADDYPSRPITLIVPYPAGGTTDLAARTIAHAMGPLLKQSIVVENRAGAGGNIGMGVLQRSDAARDFAPLAMVFTTPNVIAVRQDAKWKSVQDLFADARQRKDALISYASPGVGSSVHVTGAYLEQAAGINMLHVPFKGVSASMPALIGGQIDVLMDNLPSTISQLKDGSRVRALAVTSAERSPLLPDVPTVAESGLKDFPGTAWLALYAPAGTPAEAQAKLIETSKQALATPAVQEQFSKLGATPGSITGKDLAAFEVAERERWGKLIKERNITTD